MFLAYCVFAQALCVPRPSVDPWPRVDLQPPVALRELRPLVVWRQLGLTMAMPGPAPPADLDASAEWLQVLDEVSLDVSASWDSRSSSEASLQLSQGSGESESDLQMASEGELDLEELVLGRQGSVMRR
jgi:hypothetical protein